MNAPIAVFAYNRPDHLAHTIEALKRNDLAENSPLHVFCDGPSNDLEIVKTDAVRSYARHITGFLSVDIIVHQKNLGLATSIKLGVSEIVKRYGKIIVLEDDIVTSPCFLTFMNNALEKYKDSESVMSVSGYLPNIRSNPTDEAFFSRWFSCWGWATWQRAWNQCIFDPKAIRLTFNRTRRYQFGFEGAHPDFWRQLVLNERGKLNTWAIYFYASIFLKNGLNLFPPTLGMILQELTVAHLAVLMWH